MADKTKGITNVPVSIEGRAKLNRIAAVEGRLQRATLERLIDEKFKQVVPAKGEEA